MADPAQCPPLTRASVIAAHEIIRPYIHYTPVLTNKTITEIASTPQSPESLIGTPWEGQKPANPKIRVWFKCENLQKVGAFKARGAFHALLRLEREEGWERKKGVVTHSSGNHAQALSLAARTLDIPATIVMPTISTPSKIAATKSYGSKVIFCGSTSQEREAVVADVIKETGARLVPPYDHNDIILGQGTMGLEMQAQVEEMIVNGGQNDGAGKGQAKCSFAVAGRIGESKSGKRKGLDVIITGCGGGGMLSGVALSCEDTGITVFGAEPSYQGGDDCARGLAARRRIETVKTLTIADGLRTTVGEIPWTIIHDRQLVRQVYGVTEEMIKKAMRLVFERMKVVVEPSAVVALAVVLFHEGWRALVEREAGAEGWDVGCVLSGGNVSLEALGGLFAAETTMTEERQEGVVGGDGIRVVENVPG